MAYLLAGIAYLREMGVMGFILAPFLIWLVGEILWVGFFFPSVKALRDRVEKSEKIEGRWKYVWSLGSRRAISYTWEIFFASLGGIVVTDIYWMILGLTEQFLPPYMYIIVTFISTFLLGTLLFAKGNGIMSETPSSPIGGVKYLWGGFINPFKTSHVSKIHEIVNTVNEELMNSPKIHSG